MCQWGVAMPKLRRHVQQSEWGTTLARLMASSRDCKTQDKLSRKSGVAQATIGRILRGEANPQISTVLFLSEALKTPLNMLVYGSASIGQREVIDARIEVLDCREFRERAERALKRLRRKESDAIERLKELLRSQGGGAPPI